MDMNREAFLGCLDRLGKEMERRGMHEEVAGIRLSALAARHGLLPPPGGLEVQWSEPLVLEWLKTLQLPPFEDTYQVREEGVPCLRCRQPKGHKPSGRRECAFPGGARLRCDNCGAVWLVKEPAWRPPGSGGSR